MALRGSRLAEGSIRSARLRCKQRYRFDVTSMFSRAALPRRHREPDMRMLWCDVGQKKAEQAWLHGRMRMSSVHQVTLLLGCPQVATGCNVLKHGEHLVT